MSGTRTYRALLAGALCWCLAIIAVPLLHAAGSLAAEGVAGFLDDCFARVCHQMDSRSFHLWGEPFGVCVRCTSIYGGFLLGMLMYPLWVGGSRRKAPSRWWLVGASCPTALDAALNILGVAGSTELTRTVSGILVGLVLPAYIVPLLAEALSELSGGASARRQPRMEEPHG